MYLLWCLFAFSFLRTDVYRVMEKGFHPDTGLFSQCSAGTLYPNPSSLRISDGEDVKHTLANYHFLGRMLVCACLRVCWLHVVCLQSCRASP